MEREREQERKERGNERDREGKIQDRLGKTYMETHDRQHKEGNIGTENRDVTQRH